jgi:hypothetical protein
MLIFSLNLKLSIGRSCWLVFEVSKGQDGDWDGSSNTHKFSILWALYSWNFLGAFHTPFVNWSIGCINIGELHVFTYGCPFQYIWTLFLPPSLNWNLGLESSCSLCIHAPGCFTLPLCVWKCWASLGLQIKDWKNKKFTKIVVSSFYRFIWFMEFWKGGGGRLVWCLQWWLECTVAMHPTCWERSLAVSSYQVLCCFWSKWTSLCNWLTKHIQPNPTKTSRISQQLMRTGDLE